MNLLNNRAYHESGHAIITYLSGYFCQKLEITDKHPLENREDYDFGKDTRLISAIYQYKNNPDIYDNLQLAEKNNFRKVSLRTIIVLLGGPAAEMIYKNGGKVNLNQNFSMTGDDFEIANNIDYFLSMAKQGQHATNYLKVLFKQVLTLMEAKEVWSAISTLAETLMRSDEKKLEKKDIQKILIETGFLHYLGKFRQANGSQTAKTTKAIQTAQASPKVQPVQTAQTDQTDSAPSGFSREELLKIKEAQKKKALSTETIVSKKEGLSKIATFAKGNRYCHFKIGLADSIEQLKEIDKNRYVAFDTESNVIAKDVLMYFICLGMEISPGSSKSNSAASVFVIMTESISPGTGT